MPELTEVERQVLRAERERLRVLLAVIDHRLGDDPGKAPAAGTPPSPRLPGDKLTGRRESLLTILGTHGPTRQYQLAKRLQCSSSDCYEALQSPWFRKAGPHFLAPYQLSDAGREEFSRRTGSSRPGGS